MYKTSVQVIDQSNKLLGLSILLGLFIFFSSAQVQSQEANFDPDVTRDGFRGSVRDLAKQADGKILVAGSFDSVDGVSRSNVARIDENGELDPSFNSILNNTTYAVAVQADGKVIVGGFFSRAQDVGGNAETYIRTNLVRLDTDGNVDPDFNPRVNGSVYTILIQDDGKILIGGNFTQVLGRSRNRLARLNADGSLDDTFSDKFIDYSVYDIEIQDDAKIVIAGDFTRVDFAARRGVARLNGIDGSLDTTFANPNVNKTVNSIAIQDNGGIIIAGSFGIIGQLLRNSVARLNSDGSLDIGFSRPFQDVVYNRVEEVALQADGKILIGGRFYLEDQDLNLDHLARLEDNGDIDFGFKSNISTISNNNFIAGIDALLIEDDNKILVGGFFNRVDGTSRNSLARLNTDGSLDGAPVRVITPIMMLLLE